MSLHPRQLLLDTEEVKLELEATNGIGWTLHCDVHKWSKDIFRDMLEIWDQLISFLKDNGISEIFIYANTSMPYKFANMFGFAPTGLIGVTHDGREAPIWRYEICHRAQ